MEELASKAKVLGDASAHLVAVKRIANHGKTNEVHVHADLVGATGLNSDIQQRGFSESLQYREMRDRLATSTAGTHLLPVMPLVRW